jgi:uroporphyrinogen III methyltransferase/synthase
VVPEQAVGEALAGALEGTTVTRALVARAREARDVVPEALTARGAEVDVLPVYETVADPLDADQIAAVAGADYITFTSASTVHHFLQAAGGVEVWNARGESRPRTVSIGPVTSAALRGYGLEPDVEATSHDIDGVIDAILTAGEDAG